MNQRLEKILSYIENGTGVADVGTDHAYLPIELAKNAYTGHIFASDINEEPINLAKSNASEAGVAEKIEFCLCDGLEGCSPESVDTIVIAGMGGDTIVGILDRAEWCMDEKYTLLLQPMSKQEVVRYWLVYNEFEILNEDIVEEGDTLYQIIRARFGGETVLNDAELFTGEFEKAKTNSAFPKMLSMNLSRFSRALNSLKNTDKDMSGKINLMQDILSQLQAMEEKL